MWIVKLALRRPYTFVVMALLILLLGVSAIKKTPTDIFPEIDIPVVTVVWQYAGLSPDQMAKQITTFSEYTISSAVDNVKNIESQTLAGVSVIRIFFQPNVRIDSAIAQVTAVSQTILRRIPPGAQPPTIIRYNASSVPILSISGRDGLKSDWATLLGSLEIGEAALLSGVDWLDHVPQRFTTAQRITMHVRHRAKYLDVPMPKRNAFVFTDHGRPVSTPARTLEQFVTAVELLPIATIDDHAKRGDFSRWIGEVFGDQPLAVAIGQVEEQYRLGHVADLAKELVSPIHERYELGQ
jgi:hypothetical protein